MQARRLRIAVLLSGGLLLLAVALGSALILDRLRASARGNAVQMVQRVARVAESTVNRHFLAVDGMLAGLPAVLGQVLQDAQPDRAAANRMLRDLNFQNLNFRDLVILRPDGLPWASALSASRNHGLPLDPARIAEARQTGAAVVSGPVRNPLTGEWALLFLRSMALPGLGEVIAVAEVPVSLVATMLAPVGEVPGLRISVERWDAHLLASLPHDETRIGRRLPRGAAQLPRDGTAIEMPGRFTTATVLAAARPLLYRDIAVVASLEIEEAMAEYHQDRERLALVALGSMLLLGALMLALNGALRQRERIEAERAAARRLLESAIETMPDGFVMFDAEDRLVICNQRYRDLYAVSAPFIAPGARFEDIMREGAKRGQYPQAGADIEAFVAEMKAWHRGNHPPMERLLPDGRWLLVTERRLPHGGTVGIRTDITDLKHAMTDLAQARDAAAAATAAKSRFLARMSHELRTPLNGVLGLAQVLARDPALSGEQRAWAETLEAAGRHLVAVANDVLDLAKVETGRLELRPAPVAFPALLRDCATLVRAAAEEKRIDLAVELAETLPATVEIDQTRMRQMLLNLLSNAVKFTPPGGRVELAAQPLAPAGGDGPVRVRIEVRDTGPGVPDDQRGAIFGDFVQLDRGKGGGSGLGLAIAAGIVGQMGGRIGCAANPRCPPGEGAVFWAELPLRQASPRPPEVAPPALAPRRPLHILVADDVPANLAVARALLEAAGHSVHCVPDGAEAVRAVAEAPPDHPFDVVLMDVMMPGTDGLEATRQIRALPGPAARLPILAVTASAFAEDIAACREAGMDAHLAKPIEREALVAVLARLSGEVWPAVASAPDAGSFRHIPLFSREAGSALAVPGLDAEASRSLAAEFVREMRDATEQLRETEAVPAEGMIPSAHRLAGAAATLGAARLTTAARRLMGDARGLTPEGAAALRAATLAIAEETLASLAEEGTPLPGGRRAAAVA
ncbi:PAS-domain containing protein [Paracraurococcus lichenis]|uniref:histidine kinase n=1 Tax=Paracraurococcus lichenis TaxID=3064888 RepID=A0ABT9E1S1_9PROT|nr:PAS-domain containing protein [Paracraurococcus sp. LOR1-02]MDO9710088.1 PAS-domain containing protein [Paracraurococcus sp. LOR1-02]